MKEIDVNRLYKDYNPLRATDRLLVRPTDDELAQASDVALKLGLESVMRIIQTDEHTIDPRTNEPIDARLIPSADVKVKAFNSLINFAKHMDSRTRANEEKNNGVTIVFGDSMKVGTGVEVHKADVVDNTEDEDAED